MSTRASLRLVGIDELSNVRYIHSSALKSLGGGQLSETEVEAFNVYVYSDQYTARLAEMVRARRLFGADVDGQLAATAGWVPANDSGSTARLVAVFASPMFAGTGLARMVTTAAEADGAHAGFQTFNVRSPVGAIGFFLHLGYEISSHGVWTLKPDVALPVGFLRKPLSSGLHHLSSTDGQA